jgi:hypothetical protein
MPSGSHVERRKTLRTVLRVTIAAGIVAIPTTVLNPDAGALVGFWLFTVWVNGPISFLFPGGYEPVLLLFGSLYAPASVATVGVVGTVYVEYLNYRLYEHLLEKDAASRLTTASMVVFTVKLFQKAPFLTIWLCGLLLPYWPIRIVSPLAGYPVPKHLLATFLGRFPRLFLVSSLGAAWQLDQRYVLAAMLCSLLLACILWYKHFHRLTSPKVSTK